jgi:hypothetical protein
MRMLHGGVLDVQSRWLGSAFKQCMNDSQSEAIALPFLKYQEAPRRVLMLLRAVKPRVCRQYFGLTTPTPKPNNATVQPRHREGDVLYMQAL